MIEWWCSIITTAHQDQINLQEVNLDYVDLWEKISMSMTSRERVRAVLDHKIPDRVPIILGVSNATGIKMTPYQGIKLLVGIHSRGSLYL